MSQEMSLRRRNFLKKAAGSAGVVSVVVGTTTETARAESETTLTVSGYNGGGNYTVSVDDLYASEGDDTEPSDNIVHKGTTSRIGGAVGADQDTYYFTGGVLEGGTDGDVDMDFSSGFDDSKSGSITVSGHGYYRIDLSREFESHEQKTEPSDESGTYDGGAYIEGYVNGDKDRFKVAGEITYIRMTAEGDQSIGFRYR